VHELNFITSVAGKYLDFTKDERYASLGKGL